MSAQPAVRPFRRADRDQLTTLINAHVAAVVPGLSVSVNTVLSSLERQPDEFVTDPWVAERVTLVAEQRGHLVAAAHLLRYRDDASVGSEYRDAAEIGWFLHRPPSSLWPGAEKATDLLMAGCLTQLTRWRPRARYADGALPAPAIYGLPRPWPHIREAYLRAGFRHTGGTEVVLIARADELPRPRARQDLAFERTLGESGTRFTAYADDGDAVGFIEVDTALGRPERIGQSPGLADIANLHVAATERGPDLAHQLLAEAADWLRLCGADRVLAYEDAGDAAAIGLLRSAGFRELTRTDRGWRLTPG
ncbi:MULTISPECIES: GNAT family N-acetyltransferase [unclassified Streptomyces]|uniref:GNAT family N-acetyltransferase n=1 Tax=unclassified Streptomyces TaxID=2593676 RepID=UPI00278C1EED|nr:MULTISPECIES: GNAT family N-acetyltransferase [unclassified Streptomyces]